MIKFLFLIPFIVIDLILIPVWTIYSLLFWENFLLDEIGDPTFKLTNHVMDKIEFK